jgi:MerR family transcriptional regulator, light-induced transcriptional regulator
MPSAVEHVEPTTPGDVRDPADGGDLRSVSDAGDGGDLGGSVGVRIGELSRRVGVSTELLRAWERRYRLLDPARSPKGYRIYTPADELRVRAMQDQLGRGLSAAEAARVARRAAPPASPPGGTTGLTQVRPAARTGRDEPAPDDSDAVLHYGRALQRALDSYDETDAHHVFDTMLRSLSLRTVLRDVVLPYLAELGERWDSGRVDVAQEHFASNLIRGRLAGLSLGWGHGVGPRALLACPPDEMHDLPLLIFGIALNRCGWRVTFLGTNTPLSDLEKAVRHLRPRVVVLAATTATPYYAASAGLARLGAEVQVLLAGAGATPEVAAACGATALAGDPVTEAEHLDVTLRPSTAAAR